MIALDNGDKIRGDAAAATVVDYTLHGFVGTTVTQLADGQLDSSIGDLYTAGAAVGVSSIILVNTDTSARAVNLYLTPSGGTARRITPKDLSLGVGYALHTDGKEVRIVDAGGNLSVAWGALDIVNDITPQLGGNLDVNDKNIVLKFEPSADVTASGLIISTTVDTNAEGIGAPLFLAADGHFDTADADSSTTSPAVVLALETGTGTKNALVHGVLRNDAWTWTIGPGTLSLIYVSTTVGTLTQTKPSGTDDVVQPVGWALSDDCIYFCPSLIYYTHT